MKRQLTGQDTRFLLSEARQNIGQSLVLIRRIARDDPGIVRVELPRLRRQAARQMRLEKKANIYQPLEFGLVGIIAVGSMALLGLGGWVFKHHEETSLERYKLESIDKCIQENVNTGMVRAEASRVCSELFTGKDLSDVFAELSKTLMIASVAITGVYLLIRWKK